MVKTPLLYQKFHRDDRKCPPGHPAKSRRQSMRHVSNTSPPKESGHRRRPLPAQNTSQKIRTGGDAKIYTPNPPLRHAASKPPLPPCLHSIGRKFFSKSASIHDHGTRRKFLTNAESPPARAGGFSAFSFYAQRTLRQLNDLCNGNEHTP